MMLVYTYNWHGPIIKDQYQNLVANIIYNITNTMKSDTSISSGASVLYTTGRGMNQSSSFINTQS